MCRGAFCRCIPGPRSFPLTVPRCVDYHAAPTWRTSLASTMAISTTAWHGTRTIIWCLSCLDMSWGTRAKTFTRRATNSPTRPFQSTTSQAASTLAMATRVSTRRSCRRCRTQTLASRPWRYRNASISDHCRKDMVDLTVLCAT